MWGSERMEEGGWVPKTSDRQDDFKGKGVDTSYFDMYDKLWEEFMMEGEDTPRESRKRLLSERP